MIIVTEALARPSVAECKKLSSTEVTYFMIVPSMSWSERGSCASWHMSLMTLAGHLLTITGRQSRTEGRKKLNVSCQGGRHNSNDSPHLLKSSKVLLSEVVLDQSYEWKQTRNLLHLSIVCTPDPGEGERPPSRLTCRRHRYCEASWNDP